MIYDKLKKVLELKKVILVDCFDTIIYRKYSPEAILKRWLRLEGEAWGITGKQAFLIWQQANYKTKVDREEPEFKTIADNIYNRLFYISGFNPRKVKDFETYYNQLLESYYRIECSAIVIDKNLIDILKEEKNKGKNIYLVSDFYMPKQFFEHIFNYLGILDLFDDIIISSDIGLRKSTGNLFKWIIKNYHINAENSIMIGDNFQSDIKNSKKWGIEGFQIKKRSLVRKKTINEKFGDCFEKNLRTAPLANYAFALYLFLLNLTDFIIQNEVMDIYFCAREGEFLKEIFDKLIKKIQPEYKVRTHYLLVSRKATFLPSLNENLEQECFETLRISAPNISIEEFIKTLGLELKNFSGCKNINNSKSVPDFFNSVQLRNLKSDPYFVKYYKETVRKEKFEFKNYLATEGITEKMSQIFLVDIGWRGTIQDNLFNFFDHKIKVTGLYYGLEHTSNLSPNNRKYGLVYTDVPYKSNHFDIFSTNHRMLERILQASHGSADHYRNGKCVFSHFEDKEAKLYQNMEYTKKNISCTIDSLNEIFADFPCSNEEISNIIATLHEAYLSLYTAKLCEEENKSVHLMSMTFGTSDKKISRTFKDILKLVYGMSDIERKNKVLKLLRRCHMGLLASAYVSYAYKTYKKKILTMEV